MLSRHLLNNLAGHFFYMHSYFRLHLSVNG
jgi:hypothetical protein